MKHALAYLLNYLRTYKNQLGWESYTQDTWIKDILYGLGLSISKKRYGFRDGFDLFLIEKIKPLIEEIENDEVRSRIVQRSATDKESEEASSEDCTEAGTSSR